jgi:hypothetical protein
VDAGRGSRALAAGRGCGAPRRHRAPPRGS